MLTTVNCLKYIFLGHGNDGTCTIYYADETVIGIYEGGWRGSKGHRHGKYSYDNGSHHDGIGLSHIIHGWGHTRRPLRRPRRVGRRPPPAPRRRPTRILRPCGRAASAPSRPRVRPSRPRDAAPRPAARRRRRRPASRPSFSPRRRRHVAPLRQRGRFGRSPRKHLLLASRCLGPSDGVGLSGPEAALAVVRSAAASAAEAGARWRRAGGGRWRARMRRRTSGRRCSCGSPPFAAAAAGPVGEACVRDGGGARLRRCARLVPVCPPARPGRRAGSAPMLHAPAAEQ